MNIFLVEDERWALKELADLFRRYESRHRVYTFDNGEDALSASRKVIPQLVLTDITMPGLDGLELCKALKRLYPDVRCMILSVHEKFSYVQQGVRIGVVDYLLKPIRKDALYWAVDQAIQSIDEAEAQKEAVRNRSIGQLLLSSGQGDEEIAEQLFRSRYAMAVLLLGNWGADMSWNELLKDRSVLEESLSGCAEGTDPAFHIIDIDSRRKVLLALCTAHTDFQRLADNMTELHKQLCQNGLCVHMSYDWKKENEHADKWFNVLNERIATNMRLGHPTLAPPGLRKEDADLGGVWDLVRLLAPTFKQGELRKGKAVLQSIIEELERKEVTFGQLQLFISDMFYSLKYKLDESAMKPLWTQQVCVDIPNTFTQYRELLEWLWLKLELLYRDCKQEELKPKELVPKIMQWVRGNYQNNISLQQFAAEHHVSLGYLSRIFKEQTGETFSSYITRHRVEKAKQLLEAGIDPPTDLSALVGYEDPKHFRHVFKKLVGESPSTYFKRRFQRK